MTDEMRLGKWMVVAERDEVTVLDAQSRKLIATVQGVNFEERFTRALLISTSPNLQEVVRAAYWLFKTMGEHDLRIAGAAEEFLPCLESALYSTGGVGENPLRRSIK